MPLPVFIRCLRFYTVGATFFMFNQAIYEQAKGLAMINRREVRGEGKGCGVFKAFHKLGVVRVSGKILC